MSFQEMFDRYRQGTATPEEQELIREEIAKYEQISDYLCERLELGLGAGDVCGGSETGAGETGGVAGAGEIGRGRRGQEASGKHPEEFARLINRSIRRAFLKFGAVMTAVFLAILLFLQFGLSPLMDRLYYDPGEVPGDSVNQLTMDLNIYGELNNLDIVNYDAAVFDRGYGTYDIRVNQVASRDRTFQSVGGFIRRGHMTLYDPSILRLMSNNVFVDLLRPDQWAGGTPQQAAAGFAALDENQSYRAYISFDRDLSFRELKRFEEEHELGGWAAVRTSQAGGNLENLGFMTSQYTTRLLESWDEERYPELALGRNDQVDQDFFAQLDQKTEDEETMKTHFLSLLKYMADSEEFLALVEDVTPGMTEDYQGACDYVKEHGLAFYGYGVTLAKAELLELSEAEHVYGIYIAPTYR